MSEPSRSGEDTLPLADLQAINELCDRFVAAWKAGERPRIEDVLAGASEKLRPKLLRELLDRELFERKALGEQPIADEYLARFPDDAEMIKGAFADPAGELVGRFRVLRFHKSGGLGEVFVARDEEVQRDVAFKRIQQPFSHIDESRAKFEFEAGVTGRLEHPGIVPVYGLGHYADGRPFYAMRFIKGENTLSDAIKTFHKDRAADSGDRPQALFGLLRRFLDVCNAIAYAHGEHILHRDIKPQNIMLGAHGETVVIDWGLAKNISDHDAPSSVEANVVVPEPASDGFPTRSDQLKGTPRWMAPEQARGDAVGFATDVYALGATLFAILTGRAPIEKSDVATTLDKVKRGDFPRPRSLARWVDPALEAVCLKAMSLKPEDRYPSPRDLAADVERWLAEEPVSAWKEPLPRRTRRWAKQHRTLVTTAASLLMLSAVGLGLFAAQRVAHARALNRKNIELVAANAEITKQRDRAEKREDDAIAAVRRFGDVVAKEPVLKNSPALKELRKMLLSEPLTFFKALRDQLQKDRDTKPESLQRLALAAFALGNVTNEIGDLQDALRAFEESLAILERLARENPTVTEHRSAVAAIHNNIGVLQSRTGRPADALDSHRKALAIRNRQARENPTVTQFQSLLAESHNNIGILQGETGRPVDALESYAKALAIQERLARENPTVTEFQSDLATGYNNIGARQFETDRPADALDSFEKARAIREQLARENPTVTEYQSDLASSHRQIGVLQREACRPADALESFAKALAIQERLARENHTVTEYQSELALSHNDIGTSKLETDRPADALESYATALTITERLARENPTVTEFQRNLAGSHNNIGNLQSQTGRPADALESYAKALTIRERLARENPTVTEYQHELAVSHGSIGELQRKTGRSADALDSFAKALTIRERLAREHPESPKFASELGATLNNMAAIDIVQQRWVAARSKLKRAINAQKRALAANPKHHTYRHFFMNHLTNLIMATQALRNDDEAAAARKELDELKAGTWTLEKFPAAKK